jgi:hypothetical protein
MSDDDRTTKRDNPPDPTDRDERVKIDGSFKDVIRALLSTPPPTSPPKH